MKIVLTAVDDQLLAAWRHHCSELLNVTLYQGSILTAACDAVVSPANSFGFMDGGIDAVYIKHFGELLQRRLQQIIQIEFDGELVVGTAALVPTGNDSIKYLIAAPTMRVPGRLPAETVNPYLAARAALLVAKRFGVVSVAFPGLGTGVGAVPVERCAKQVRRAIADVVLEQQQFPLSWPEACHQHQRLL